MKQIGRLIHSRYRHRLRQLRSWVLGNADFITRLWQMDDGLPHKDVGLIKKVIADTLSANYQTIDTHLRTIYQKLHVHTRTGAVAEALKEEMF